MSHNTSETQRVAHDVLEMLEGLQSPRLAIACWYQLQTCRNWTAKRRRGMSELTGISFMAAAIGAQFGWNGVVFCLGVVIYCAGKGVRRQGDRA